MGNIITPVLPHDLPENWTDNQYVTPGGVEAGLSEQHGFNYLMKQVNNAQKAINELDENALSLEDRFELIEGMYTHNDFFAPICTDDGASFVIIDDSGNVIVADWFFQTDPTPLPESPEQVVQTGVQMELLWENASPSSDFAAQTVALDLDGFDMVKVVAYHQKTAHRVCSEVSAVAGESGVLRTFPSGTNTYRYFEVSLSGVNFEDTRQTSTSANNEYIIPARIYGIKGVKTE